MEMTIMEATAVVNTIVTTVYTLITLFIFWYIARQFGEVKRTRQIAAFPNLRQLRSPTEAGKRIL